MDLIFSELENLKQRIEKSDLPEKLRERMIIRIIQLSKLTSSPSFLPEFDRLNKYIDWVLSIPWGKFTQDVLDIERARKILDKNHFGLESIKDRIIEYIAVMKLKSETAQKEEYRAPILCFVGLVGTGKTTIAYSIAEALGRKFARIPFGGMGDPLDLRGKSRVYPESEPGKVIKALIDTESMNPVILLDEIDRVTPEGWSSIMGVLVELLDPKQNHSFVDHYVDYPVDLSKVLFIATANNTTNIATAVLDRIEPIVMPSYSDHEKIVIGRDYILPRLIKDASLPERALVVQDDVWPYIVRPLGYDAGIRSLERHIEEIVRKTARLLVEGKVKTVIITKENVKEFISL